VDLIRPAQRFFIKGRERPLVLERGAPQAGEEALRRHFIHEDGRLRVPVLLAGHVAARGFTPALYRAALSAAGLWPG
jgi:hypothetical protein